MPDLSILIISYNTRELTLACLESVYAETREVSVEVIVVDNESADGSADAIEAAWPQVRVIRPGANLGFAAGNNLAAREARGEFLLLLNPDTVVLEGGIDRIVKFARERPGAGVYGGRTFFADMRLNRNSCHGRPTPWSLLCMGVGLSSVFRKSRLFNPEGLGAWPRDTVREVDCVSGCFFLIRRALWERLGGFDTEYFMYGEDTDLSIRAAAAAGPNLICPEARIIHYGGRSEKVRADKMVRLFRAKVQLFEKHWERASVPFGVRMLQLWALTRWVALNGIAWIRPQKRAAAQAWGEVFRRRDEYAAGQTSAYAAAMGLTPAPTSAPTPTSAPFR